VKRIHIAFFIILSMFILTTFLIGQDISFDYSVLNYTANIKKDVYAVGEPIEINNLIKNMGSETIAIEVSDVYSLNFDFVLYTLNGKLVEKSMNYYEKKERAIQNLKSPRKETLFPDEQYGQTITLNEYYDDLEPGRYILEPIFFPLTNMADTYPSVYGKKIQIRIVPIPYEENVAEVEDGVSTDAYKPLPPYETVDFILNAKLKGNWEAFFAYIDLSSIITLYSDWNERLNKLPKSKRYKLLEEFKKYLIANFEQDMIDYDVVRESREKNNSIVIAEIYKGKKRVTFTSRYTFSLEKRNEYWIVVSYSMVNLGQ